MTLQWAAAHSAAADKTQRQREIENYTRASGKMLLLHKLLPKLRAEGRQVSHHDWVMCRGVASCPSAGLLNQLLHQSARQCTGEAAEGMLLVGCLCVLFAGDWLV